MGLKRSAFGSVAARGRVFASVAKAAMLLVRCMCLEPCQVLFSCLIFRASGRYLR